MASTEAEGERGGADRQKLHYTEGEKLWIVEQAAAGTDRSVIAARTGRTEDGIRCFIRDIVSGRNSCQADVTELLKTIRAFQARKAAQNTSGKLFRTSTPNRQVVEQYRTIMARLDRLDDVLSHVVGLCRKILKIPNAEEMGVGQEPGS